MAGVPHWEIERGEGWRKEREDGRSANIVGLRRLTFAVSSLRME